MPINFPNLKKTSRPARSGRIYSPPGPPRWANKFARYPFKQHAAAALLLVALLLFTGCQTAFERYYVPASIDTVNPPTHLPPIPAATIVITETGELDPHHVKAKLYPDATLLGSSTFVGGYQSGSGLRKLAATLGADVVLWSAAYLSTVIYTDYQPVPRTDETIVQTITPRNTTVTRIQTDSTDIVPRTVTKTRYQHDVLFLRK